MKFVSVQGKLSLFEIITASVLFFPKIYFRCNLTYFESENFSDSSLLYPNFKSENFSFFFFFFFSQPGECNVKLFTSENRRKLIR